MDAITLIVGGAFLVLIAGAIATWALFFAISRLFERTDNLIREIASLKESLPKRDTHANAMTKENIIAQVLYVKRELYEAQQMNETLLNIMQDWRGNPSYDPELPVDAQRQPSTFRKDMASG